MRVLVLLLTSGLLAASGTPAGADTPSAQAVASAAARQTAPSSREVSRVRRPAQPDRAKVHRLIDQTARRHGVEPALVHAVIAAESAYNARAVSPAGAIGLMQVMPATAEDYGVSDHAALFDPAINIDTGVRHLRRLLRKYEQDYARVLMAYNAGEGVVDRTNSNVRYPETLDYLEAVARSYRRLGGTKSPAPILRRVAALRKGSGHNDGPRSKTGAHHDERVLPQASPRLAAGIPVAPLIQRVPSADSAPREGDRGAGREHVVSRPAMDPAVRDVAQTGLARQPGRGRLLPSTRW